MSDYFRFKHFTIWQDRCAMKVGTDSVLLSAWVCSLMNDSYRESSANNTFSVLDIGTGTGIISMQIASEFPSAKVMAIDIDEPSVCQARSNVETAGMSERICVNTIDFTDTKHRMNTIGRLFDVIVTNPPFYDEDTHNTDKRENAAKHTTTLSFTELIDGVNEMLHADGVFFVILPHAATYDIIGLCAERCLYLTHRCDIFTTSKAQSQHRPQRTLLAFGHTIQPTQKTELVLNNADGTNTEEYKHLTRNMYSTV